MIRLITTFIITFLLFVTSTFSQKITGDWYGQLDIHGTKLRINFHITEKDGVFKTTMDSPDQDAFGMPTDDTKFTDNDLSVSLKSIGVTFKGKLKADEIDGTFTQGGMNMPLHLTHKKIEKVKAKKRPQDPVKPYNYKSEEVTFVNETANNIKLSGTLTLPKGVKNPAVAILISGSGPQNRDEEVQAFNHRPFLVLSDYLTNNGIAVLRYDDRGVAKSEGSQIDATSADFATDVEAAVTYLQSRTDIDTNKIGLIGHSEGGLIAPIVASNNKNIAFIVSLAGPGVDGGEVLRTQTKRAFELAGADKKHIDYNDKMSGNIFKIIQKSKNDKTLNSKITTYIQKARKNAPESLAKSLTDEAIKKQIKSLTSPWIAYFIKTDPKQFLCEVECPVLAINGEKDFQVIPKLNLEGLKKGLKKSKDVTIMELEGLNHLFQNCDTGSVEEYKDIEETFSPKALKIISDWINKRF
ncbi:MAG: alpha/beta hydrolase [Flavobacteriaceae bacterium]